MLKTPCGTNKQSTCGSLMEIKTPLSFIKKPLTVSKETLSMASLMTAEYGMRMTRVWKGLYYIIFLIFFNPMVPLTPRLLLRQFNLLWPNPWTTFCANQEVEVHKALKQMHPKKSPSPDGMPPLFYQHFWSLSGECVTKAVLDFLNLGIIPPKFNETHVILIPKV